MIIEGTVQSLPAESVSDGESKIILGKSRELITSGIYGKYYNAAKAGRMFAGNQAAAGAVIPIYSNTTQQCGLFNPLGSGVDIIPVRLNVAYVSETGAAGGLCLGYIKNCGGSIATGSPGITAATETIPINLRFGSGPASKVKFLSSGITTAAPAVLMELDINQTVLTAATTSSPQWKAGYDFDGYPVVEPGTSIFVAGNIAVLIKVVCTLIWIEVPV
jgi:hypothetical protein